jgi:hypothetical protein
MVWLIAIAVVAAVAFLVYRLLSAKSDYYGRIFNDDHFREVHAWLVRMIAKGEVKTPVEGDGTTLLTSAGVRLVYTRDLGAGDSVHVSISEARGYTTRAVASRIGFIVFFALNRNPAGATLYVSQTTVHHMVFDFSNGVTQVRPVEEVLEAMRADFVHLPFRHVDIPGLKRR